MILSLLESDYLEELESQFSIIHELLKYVALAIHQEDLVKLLVVVLDIVFEVAKLIFQVLRDLISQNSLLNDLKRRALVVVTFVFDEVFDAFVLEKVVVRLLS